MSVVHTTAGASQRSGLADEQHRALLDDAAQAYYARRNPEIDLSRTAINIDLVNNGDGNFVPAKSPGEVVSYGNAREAKHRGKIRKDSRTTHAVVFHLPEHMCVEEEYVPERIWKKSEVELDGKTVEEWVVVDNVDEETRTRLVARDHDEMLRYFAACRKKYGGDVLGSQDAIHGVAINLDEHRPHMQLICDSLIDHPDFEGALKTGFTEIWGTGKTPPKRDADGNVVQRPKGEKTGKETGKEKLSRYHHELRAHLIGEGFEVELENSDRHLEHEPLASFKASKEELTTERRELETVKDDLDHVTVMQRHRQKRLDKDQAAVNQRKAEVEKLAQGAAERTQQADEVITEARAAIEAAEAHMQVIDRENEKAIDAAVRRATDADLTKWLQENHPDLHEKFVAEQTQALKPQARQWNFAGAMSPADMKDRTLLVVDRGRRYKDGNHALHVEIDAGDKRITRHSGLLLAAHRDPKTKEIKNTLMPYSAERFEAIKQAAGDNVLTERGSTTYKLKGDIAPSFNGGGLLIWKGSEKPSPEPLTKDWRQLQAKGDERCRAAVKSRMASFMSSVLEESQSRSDEGMSL